MEARLMKESGRMYYMSSKRHPISYA